jgi:hypothetical protein
MSPGDLKLPAVETEAFVMDPGLEKLLRWQWRVDPPWILKYLRDEIVREMYGAMLNARAEMAKIDIQAKQVEARMFEEMSRIAAQRGK